MRISPLLLTVLIAALFWTSSARGTTIDRVLVDKSKREMYLLSNGEIIRQYNVALGAAPKGHKRQEGDERTPEGIYILDYVNEKSSFYRSMHINYPNATDLRTAMETGVDPGGMIMVHGQKNGTGVLSPLLQLFDWTDGCIALSNSEMDEFISLVPVGTEIEIKW